MGKSDSFFLKLFKYIVFAISVSYAGYIAYSIRLYAIKEIWPGIHEFDPWFNYRATEYYEKHGWKKFFTWYDHRSWYPIGRPIGTTIYPGLQIAAVAVYRVLQHFGILSWSLYDICVYFPAWFGIVATWFVGMLGWECTGSVIGGIVSAFVMSVIPCHSMRSIGGGFDNECLAMSTMVMTFYFWVRSLRKESSLLTVIFFSIIAGISEIAMAAAWGGYVFVVNMIGIHALFLIVKFYFFQRAEWKKNWKKFYFAYTLWYAIATFGSTKIPVIGNAPLTSMEQVCPLFVFVIFQIICISELFGAKLKSIIKNIKVGKKKGKKMSSSSKYGIISGGVALAAVVFFILYVRGFFGPISYRVRSLFIVHSKTGNPLVDSVAEHQPTSQKMYHAYLGVVGNIAPLAIIFFFTERTNSKWFLGMYALITYYFSQKMNRLIILMAVPTSMLTGMVMSKVYQWVVRQPFDIYKLFKEKEEENEEEEEEKKKKKKKGKRRKKHQKIKESENIFIENYKSVKEGFLLIYNSVPGVFMRLVIIALIVFLSVRMWQKFYAESDQFAMYNSNPQVVFKARGRDGQEFIVDDYLKAYEWLEKNTPDDSRILSWWDYGYQINGIGKRITLADGNTWNLEHIAFIGRMMVLPAEESYKTARHVADYVLVWSGQGSGDLAKSPQMARIASSVYDICGLRDPLCRSFGFSRDRDGQLVPSPFMKKSMLYNLVMNGRDQGAYVDPKKFKERWQSKHGLVRIYQIMNTSPKSKKWAMDPENWVCDAPGSWYCVGQYPPAVEKPPTTHRNIHYNNKGEVVFKD